MNRPQLERGPSRPAAGQTRETWASFLTQDFERAASRDGSRSVRMRTSCRFRGSKHESSFRRNLTPAQWLPKPATSQFPHTRRTLRVLWSPDGGEGEETQGLSYRDRF